MQSRKIVDSGHVFQPTICAVCELSLFRMKKTRNLIQYFPLNPETTRSLPTTKSLDLDKHPIINHPSSSITERSRSAATTSMTTSHSENHGFHSKESRHTVDVSAKAVKIEKREESKPRSEGFFRNFLNRSARKLAATSKDASDTTPLAPAKATPVIVEELDRKPAAPIIAKEDTLSILDVLARARNADRSSVFEPTTKSVSIDHLHECDTAKLPPIKITEKNPQVVGARQRIQPQEMADCGAATQDSNGKCTADERSAMMFSSPMKTSYRIECRNLRQTQYRSEEFLSSERSSRYLDAFDGKTETGPHSISLPKSVWPNEGTAGSPKFVQSPVKLSSSPKWNQCQTKISSTTKLNESPSKTVEKSKSFRLYTKAQGGSAEDNRYSKYKSAYGGNMPSLPDLSANNGSPPRASNEFVSMFLSGGGGGGGGGKNSNRDSFSFDSTSSLGSADSPPDRYDIDDFGYMPKAKSLRAELDGGNKKVSDSAVADGVVAHKPLGEIEDSIDQIMKSSLTTVLRKSSTTDLYQVRTTTSDRTAAELIKGGDIIEGKELGVATVVSPPLLHYSLTASKLDTKAFGHSKSSSSIPEFLQVQLNRKETAAPANKKTLTPEEEKKRRMSSESIEIADQRSSSADRNLPKSNEHPKFRTRSAIALDSSEDSRSTDDSEFGDTTATDASRIVDILENRKSVSDKKLKYEKRIEEIQHNIRRSSGSGTAALGTSAPESPRRSSVDDDTPAVVLRNKRKSASATTTPSDSTPELMKVFARRSLKIKDPNDYLTDAELAANEKPDAKAVSKSGVDSDKENQSTVDAPKTANEKLIKSDATSIKSKSNRISSIKERSEMLKQAASQPKDEPIKTKFKTDKRFSAPIPHFQGRKNGASAAAGANTNSVVEMKANNDNIINNNSANSATTCALNNNINSAKNGAPMEVVKPIATDDCAQFKGILERRAEWEKRANQAFK